MHNLDTRELTTPELHSGAMENQLLLDNARFGGNVVVVGYFLEILLRRSSSENYSIDRTAQNYWPNSYPFPSNNLHEKIYSLKHIMYNLSGIHDQHFFLLNIRSVYF